MAVAAMATLAVVPRVAHRVVAVALVAAVLAVAGRVGEGSPVRSLHNGSIIPTISFHLLWHHASDNSLCIILFESGPLYGLPLE